MTDAPLRRRRVRGRLGTRLGGTLLPLVAAAALARQAEGQVSLAFSGNPATMTVGSAPSAGAAPSTNTSGLTTWSLAGAWVGRPKITAQLGQAMPAGVQLEVQVTAPTGARSAGWVVLTMAAKDVVSDLPLVGVSGLGVSYRLSATAAAGKVPLSSRVVTFTLVWS